jgi:hypothetical protein
MAKQRQIPVITRVEKRQSEAQRQAVINAPADLIIALGSLFNTALSAD